MTERTDYSPVEEGTTPAEARRRRRLALAPFGFIGSLLVYAALIALVALLIIWLGGWFGEGGE